MARIVLASPTSNSIHDRPVDREARKHRRGPENAAAPQQRLEVKPEELSIAEQDLIGPLAAQYHGESQFLRPLA